MRKRFFLLSIALMTGNLFFLAIGQSRIDYRLNIVKMTNQDYGFIIGSAGYDCYFVLIRGKGEEFPSNPKVHIHESYLLTRSAEKILDYEVGSSYKIALYKMNRRAFDFSRQFYANTFNGQESFETYIDSKEGSELSAELQSSHKLNLLAEGQSSSGAIIKFEINPLGTFYRGMPIINRNGEVLALAAESKHTKPFLEAISLIAIRDKLEQLEKEEGVACIYFNFLKAGEDKNKCEQEAYKDELKREGIDKERKARAELDRKQRKEYRLSKLNTWSWGPSVSYHLSMSALLNSTTPTTGTTELPMDKSCFGLNIYLAPDAKHLRFTLKPRYTLISGGPADNSQPFTDFRLDSYKYTLIEAPVILEFGLSREEGTTFYIGLGYGPGYQSTVNFKYSTNVNLTQQSLKSQANGTSGFVQTVFGEVGLDYKRFRFSFNLSQQLGGFKGKDYSMRVGTSTVKPFGDISKSLLLFGIDLGFRFKGVWGIKNKRRPSEFLK